MLLKATLLVLLPAVVLAGPNTPTGWVCKDLTRVDVSHDDCVQESSFDNGIWTISTKRVSGGPYRFCIVSLTGPGVTVKDSDNFYVRAKFGTKARVGPYGGITFNMEDADNGNYVMMRQKVPVDGNVETGRIVNKEKNPYTSKTVMGQNKFVKAGNAELEILVMNGREDVWVNSRLEEEISDRKLFYVQPGGVGFAFQNVFNMDATISNAEVCVAPCKDDAGNEYVLGDTIQQGGKNCICRRRGFVCTEEPQECGEEMECGEGLTRWVDPETCETKCIPPEGYCSSSGDPHYNTFDGLHYDFHGRCTYQAASCGDFTVYFKNLDLLKRSPRWTKRAELLFENSIFSVESGWQAKVDDQPVQVPYEKVYNNGDRVEIVNNGQLEIRLYNKGREPSVRIRATNYGHGKWITAEVWLHGSCADETEGLCGNWNGNPDDDIDRGNGNWVGAAYKVFDEDCPAPKPPPDPCSDIGNLHEQAEALCSALLKSPFKKCHDAVPVGDRNSGMMKDCMTDVCNCFLDDTCACSQFDVYASQCENHNIDLSDWRKSVEFCPYECPEPLEYKANGATPVPTCLDRNPEQTGTVRGCFCPEGQFLQDGECVAANACKCLYEGQFYNNGDVIKKDGQCPAQTCTCRDAGEMTCEDDPCPELNCADGEVQARNDDECCNRCIGNWVVAVNPENTIKKGQSVVLTCKIMVGVRTEDITWYKDGVEINDGLTKNRLRLKIKNADADDDASYTCEATKDGITDSDDFNVDVIMPAICEHEDGTEFEEGTTYNPQETEECTCDAHGVHTCACIDDGEECEDPTPVAWFDDTCIKTCISKPGHCSASADPFYKTFDGSEFNFKGDCKYNFFGCGDVTMFADHEKDRASAKTRYLEVAFKTDVFKLEGDTVTLNGDAVVVPMHKSYKDGSKVTIEDLGTYAMTIKQDGKDPLVYLKWDKVSSYSIDVHGSCKGISKGMCGKWDDDDSNDMTGPNGAVIDSVEEFGTSWAVADEADCPQPEPEDEDMCVLFGLPDRKPEFERHVAGILRQSPFSDCIEAGMDAAETMKNAVQQICLCGADINCACAPIDKFAGDCKAQTGVDTDGWTLKIPGSRCEGDCPKGTDFMAKGPKPAPSCENPSGGPHAQAGCFCPEGQMLEDGKCVSLENCHCEYAGQLYDAGETFDKGAECKTCTCIGGGEEECEDKECNVECGENEVLITNEGECCPTCQGRWVEAVNPNPVAILGQPVALTCRVIGMQVAASAVSWFKTQPLREITSWNAYEVSEDGLTLTISKVDAQRENGYKCVVEKRGMTSEASFEVAMQPQKVDLVEAAEDQVNFIEGASVVLRCNKLYPVTKIWWTCNGREMTNGEDNVRIRMTKDYVELVFRPAKLSDKGTCTCHALGQGGEDSADIRVGGEENEVTITPKSTEVTCRQADDAECTIEFDVTSKIGNPKAKDVKFWSLKDGQLFEKFNMVQDGNTFIRSYGKWRNPRLSGQYVAVVTLKGKTYQSEPVTFTVLPKVKKAKSAGVQE